MIQINENGRVDCDDCGAADISLPHDCIKHLKEKYKQLVDEYNSQCDLVNEFKDASGLLAGGDPGDVTPDFLRDYISSLCDIVSLVQAGVNKSHPDMIKALACLPKEE